MSGSTPVIIQFEKSYDGLVATNEQYQILQSVHDIDCDPEVGQLFPVVDLRQKVKLVAPPPHTVITHIWTSPSSYMVVN